MRWAEYTAAARELAEVRGREAERLTRAGQRSAAGRGAAEQLRQRLSAQREYLWSLATRLRESRPGFDGLARTGLTDVDVAVQRAWEAIEHADADAREAEERGHRATLFPNMSTTGRNALVYAITTVLAVIASCGLFVATPGAGVGSLVLLPGIVCGLPALALFAGYLTISTVGRPRLQPADRANHSVRLGGLICFGGMWLAWAAWFIAIVARR